LLNLTERKTERHAADAENKLAGFQKNLLIIGSALMLIVLLIGSALFFGGETSVSRGIGLNNQGDVSTGRFHFWQVAWQIIIHNPIIGAGLDAFGVAFTRYDTWNGLYRVEQAHNDYLQILADAGIPGFLCLLVFIFLLFKKGLQVVRQSGDNLFQRGTAVGALAGCFGILIHSFFDFPLRTPSNALFFLVLTALATISINPSKLYQRRSRRQVKASKREQLAA
jgi:O-antigen ligase